jgi:hypothetical protein
MKKLPKDEQVVLIAVGLLLLSILLMVVIIPGILNDSYHSEYAQGAVEGISLAIIIHLLIVVGFIIVFRSKRRDNKTRKQIYLVLGILLVVFGTIYIGGAVSFLDHKNIIYVPILMFASVISDYAAAILTFKVFYKDPRREAKSVLVRIPAWASSLIVLCITIALEVIMNDPKSTSISTLQIIVWIFYVILVSVACYYICKAHPKSVWYTPIICNAVGIIGLFANIFLTIIATIAGKNIGTTLIEWIIIVSSVILSIAAAIIGARIGQRNLNKANS